MASMGDRRRRADMNLETMKYSLQFDTTHNRFYIADSESPFESDSDDFWTDEASRSMMATAYEE